MDCVTIKLDVHYWKIIEYYNWIFWLVKSAKCDRKYYIENDIEILINNELQYTAILIAWADSYYIIILYYYI